MTNLQLAAQDFDHARQDMLRHLIQLAGLDKNAAFNEIEATLVAMRFVVNSTKRCAA
jgi:hypothetical protein